VLAPSVSRVDHSKVDLKENAKAMKLDVIGTAKLSADVSEKFTPSSPEDS